SAVEYIAFESAGRLVYEAKDSLPARREITDRSDELMALAELYLEGAYGRRLRRLMAMALVRASASDSLERVQGSFDLVAQFITDKTPLRLLIGRTRSYVVAIERDGNLIWEYDDLPSATLPIIAEFERLDQTASANLQPGDVIALR